MLEVIPGILEKEWSEIERKIELVLPFAKTIHIDIADGKMVPNTTFLDPSPFKKYSDTIFFEVHMMVENPIEYLKPWANGGFKRFLGHIEKMSDQKEFVTQGQIFGEVGLAIDGPTPLSNVLVPLHDLDCILFYTSHKAGFSGPPFVPDRVEKARQVKVQSGIPIEVDGGINAETILIAKEAGVTRFVTTSFLFKAEDPARQYELLLEKISS